MTRILFLFSIKFIYPKHRINSMSDSKRGLYLVGLLVLFFLFVIYTNNSGFLGSTGSAISNQNTISTGNAVSTLPYNGGESIKNYAFLLLAGALVFTLMMTRGKAEESEFEDSENSEVSNYMANVDSLFSGAMNAHSRDDYPGMEKAMAKINSVYQNLDEVEKEQVYEKVLVFYDRIRK